MLQIFLIGVVFLGASFYVGRMVYRSFQSKNACTTGCSKCGAADLAKVLQENTQAN